MVHSEIFRWIQPWYHRSILDEASRCKQVTAAHYQRMRFGLTSALLEGGLYGFELGTTWHGNAWWYDEYESNLGAPINSTKDDFAFILNYESRRGYFSSNRDGGNGDDDIYTFNQEVPIEFECNQQVIGLESSIDVLKSVQAPQK